MSSWGRFGADLRDTIATPMVAHKGARW